MNRKYILKPTYLARILLWCGYAFKKPPNTLAYFASLLKTKKEILIRNSLAYFASLLTTKKESLFKLTPDARMIHSAVVHALKKKF